MRKLLYITIVIILLMLVIPAYIWFESKHQLDLFLAQNRAYINVDYSSFMLFTQELQLRDVVVIPADSEEATRIRSIRLLLPSLTDVLSLKAIFSGTYLPNNLSLSAEGVHLPLSSHFVTAAGNSPTANLGSLGCGDLQRFGPDEFNEMGYGNLVANIDLSYDHDSPNNILSVNVGADIEKVLQLSGSFYFSVYDSTWNLNEARQTLSRLLNGDVTLIDQSYNTRVNFFCSQAGNQSVADYLNKHIQLMQQYLQAKGMIANANLTAAYKDYISGPNRLYVSLSPDAVFNLARLPEYGATDLIQLLGLTFHLNDQEVLGPKLSSSRALADNTVLAANTVLSANTDEGTVAPTQQSSDRDEPASNQNAKQQRSFRDISPEESSNFITKPAIVVTAKGKRYRGNIMDTVDNTLQLHVRMRGGNVTYNFKYSDISTLQVYQ